MNKKVNPNFVKANAQGFGAAENFVVGAENYRPPSKPLYNHKDSAMNGNTQQDQSSNKSLIAAYKRAK